MFFLNYYGRVRSCVKWGESYVVVFFIYRLRERDFGDIECYGLGLNWF